MREASKPQLHGLRAPANEEPDRKVGSSAPRHRSQGKQVNATEHFTTILLLHILPQAAEACARRLFTYFSVRYVWAHHF